MLQATVDDNVGIISKHLRSENMFKQVGLSRIFWVGYVKRQTNSKKTTAGTNEGGNAIFRTSFFTYFARSLFLIKKKTL